MELNIIKSSIGILGAIITSLFGGWDTALATLLNIYGNRLYQWAYRCGGVQEKP